jgi:hypothetical protein
MKRTVVFAVSISLLLGVGVRVSAGPPVEESFDSFTFSCELSGEAGAGEAFIGLFAGEEGGNPFADAVIWLPGSEPFVDEPDLFGFAEDGVAVDGDQVSAVIPMDFADSGDPDGTLILEGTVGELLDEETFSDRFRDGNRWTEVNETTRFFAATATVTLDGIPFEASCSAVRGHLELRSTNPHAFRVDFDEAFVECFGIVGSDESTLNLFAGEFGSEAFLNLEIFPPNGEFEPPEFFGSAEIGSLSGNLDVTVPLFDPFDGETPVTDAQVSLSVQDGETNVSDILSQNVKVKEIVAELLVSGTVQVVVDGRNYDLDECFGSRFEVRGLVNESEGPKMTGPPPINDTPDGANPLRIGEGFVQQTKAAVIEPEASCAGVEGKTVWYTVEGTGGPLTVSTAGSHFDTVLGVFTSSGEGFDVVDCVDDTFDGGFSLQAEVTFESEFGETYYVQAGGFGLFQDPDFPEFNSLPEYGLLKISVTG